MHGDRPHWLNLTKKTWSPDVVVTFDTETVEHAEEGRLVQTLRCWDALVRIRHSDMSDRLALTFAAGERAAHLADLLEAAARIKGEAWVLAHNVGFDLSVTSLPFILAERDWCVEAVNLGDESTWWVLTKDGAKLVITDSWSWLRCGLEEAAKDVNRRKVALPANNDDDLAHWHRRCKHDVVILDQLMTTLMDWWDENELGVFGITGASCGWRAMRKHLEPERLLVGRDGARTDVERMAIYSGLKVVYGVGAFHDTWIADFDFQHAYPTVAATQPLPLAPAKPWAKPADLLTTDLPAGKDYIAVVTITTRIPCAPVRVDGDIWHPVGTFTTVLAGPEVRYAASVADEVVVHRYLPYRMGFALANWAGWVINLQSDPRHHVPPVVARVAKGWGRSVIGRFASRTSRVVGTRASTHLGWHLETGHDLDTGAAMEWLSIGGVEQAIAKDLDGPDVFPAVLAFVEAHTRVALATMIASRNPRRVLQANTDGWWESGVPNRTTYSPESPPWPFKVVRKALERSLEVLGPNHVLTPHERRLSGVAGDAEQGADGVFRSHDWPSMRWQLEHGRFGEYHLPEHATVLAEHYVKRWVLESGETIPVTVTVRENGETELVAWSSTWGRRSGDRLARYQVEPLATLLESDTELAMRVHVELPTQPGRDFVHPPRAITSRQPRSPASTSPHAEHPELFALPHSSR